SNLTRPRAITDVDLGTDDHLHQSTLFVSCQAGPIVAILTNTTPTSGPPTNIAPATNGAGNTPPMLEAATASNTPTSPLKNAGLQPSHSRRQNTARRSQPTFDNNDSSALLPCNS